MYNIYYIERLNAAGETCEEYKQAGTAKERDTIIKGLKKNPDIIEIGYFKVYSDGEPGTFKTSYKTAKPLYRGFFNANGYIITLLQCFICLLKRFLHPGIDLYTYIRKSVIKAG